MRADHFQAYFKTCKTIDEHGIERSHKESIIERGTEKQFTRTNLTTNEVQNFTGE